MAIVASLAFTGCAADGELAGDEVAGDEVASEQVANSELARDLGLTELADRAQALALAIEIRNVTCNSGWPGTRGCHWVFTSAGPIVAGTLTVAINGNNGEIGHTAAVVGTTKVDFTASVHEGDAFNPGKNSTSYTVAWLRN